jgi:hypothetical protein
MRRILVACCTIIFLVKVSIPAVEQVLIVQSREDYFSSVTNKLESELSGSFNFVKLKKVRDTNEIAGVIPNLSPKAIIIFEKHAKSSSLYWFREYLQSHSSKFSNTAFIFVKDYFIDQSEVFMDNAAGISFLPPVILGVEKLQEQSHKEIQSIGIIHSRSLRKMIIDNSASCILQGISLTMKPVPDRNDPSFSKVFTEALNNMKKQKVDALWIVEDESLLQLQLVRDVWGPFLEKSAIPTIVNNEALLAAPWNIGTVCIIPDPQQLSSQIGKKLRELQRNNWIVQSPSIDPLDIYSNQLKKISISRPKLASVSNGSKVETAINTAPRQDTVMSAMSSAMSASIKVADSMPEKSITGGSSSASIIPTSGETYASPVPVKSNPAVVSNLKAITKEQDFIPNKVKQTSSYQMKNDDHAKPKPAGKAVSENRVQPQTQKTVAEDLVQPLPARKILKNIKITSNHAAVRESPDTNSLVIGWALKGQQFPVFEEKGNNLQISFFNVSGWITTNDIKPLESMSQPQSKQLIQKVQNHLVPIIFIVLNALFAAALIVLLIVKRPSSGSVKRTSKKI